ncbi:hypothetical protein EW145_g3454 [Phellinidium pouzarii]|uniref:Reverse transcriptase Ty1/copia-type domain-containing protein n=1 Tax=Phellinidium pouzarii TaxID=167371 RepID=A0A4V3XCU9_9AGAM|nr:hypothetical protein EW145_g3454 [Phellinidium pouzarii]
MIKGKYNEVTGSYKSNSRRIPRPAPEIHPAPQPAPVSDTEPVQVQQSDEEDRDELDLMSEDEMQAEALMFTGLMDFGANAGLEDQYIAFEDAFDYVLKSTNHFEHVFSAEVCKQYGPEPYQWKDIRGRPDAHLWEQAAMEEFISLVENGTFTPVRLPSDRKTIGCRWVFKLKRKADGSVDRYKARLVAKGFSQCPGLEFSQVFAPTAKWAALRAILALAALEDLELYSIDISTAFLNGDLDHDVYMDQPEGFEEYYGAGFVLKLVKAIYGLKQAGRQWHKKLDSVLKGMGFTLVRCDNSIWVYRREDVRIIIPVYVDDMTIAAKSKDQYLFVKEELEKHFKLHDLGPTSFLLGVRVERDRSKRLLSLSQRQYIIDILERFEMSNCTTVTTPLPDGHRLSKAMAPKDAEEIAFMKTVPYRQLVGALMYLAVATRPDISYAVGVLARFSSNPGPSHWKAAKHLCRYLQGTKDMKLTYTPDPHAPELFTTFSDADHGGDEDNRRSTSGMVVKMGTGAISWASRLQTIVTLSTTEAEYISAVQSGQEIIWLRNLLSEFGYEFTGPSTLYVDNQSALAVARNPEHHGRMKHLDLRHYWLRDVVEAGDIDIKYLPTKSMPADIMTKALGRLKVVEMCGMLGLYD